MDSTTEALIQRAKATMTPNYNPAPFIAERGEGIRLFSKSGDSFLDFSSGIAVTSLGHSHPEVVEAVQSQAGRLFHTSNLFHHEAYVDACTRLSQISCLPRVFLCNSGTESVEIALKAASAVGTKCGLWIAPEIPFAHFFNFRRRRRRRP